MCPRKQSEKPASEQDLLEFDQLVDIFHKRADIVKKAQLAAYLRNLIRQYLSCVRIENENQIKYKKILESRNSLATIFQMLSSDSKYDNIGKMVFSGTRFKGLPQSLKKRLKIRSGNGKSQLVEMVNIKLDDINFPIKGKYKVNPKKIFRILESPEAKFNAEI